MTEARKSYYPKLSLKELLAIAAAGIGLTFVFGDKLSDGVARLKHLAFGTPNESLPLEFDIERARSLVNELVPVIRKNNEVIIREQVEIEELRTDITKSQAELRDQREQIMTVRATLPETSPSDGVATGGAAAPAGETRQELRHLFATYQSAEAAVNAKLQLLRSREGSLAQAKAAQNEVLRKKKELEAEVASFAARLALLKSRTDGTEMQMEQAEFEESEAIIRYIRKRLTVAERLVQSNADLDASYADADWLDDPIEAEIDRHFAAQTASLPAPE